MLTQRSARNIGTEGPERGGPNLSNGPVTGVAPTTGRSSPLKFFSSASTAPAAPRPAPAHEEPQVKAREGAHKRWTIDYLAEIRKPGGARPMGARPAPGRNSTSSFELPQRPAPSGLAERPAESTGSNRVEQLKRSLSPFGQRRPEPPVRHSQDIGRPLARQPDAAIMADIARTNAQADNLLVEINGKKSPMPYYERGQRWMEKQEAKSLRAAMNYMDIEEERRVHQAAQEEAAELVHKHKYPDMPYESPDAFKVAIKEHLRKGSHARSQSIGPFESLYVTKAGAKDGKRSASGESASNQSEASQQSGHGRVISTSSKGSNDSKSSANSKSSSGSFKRSSLSIRDSASKIFSRRRSKRGSRNSLGAKAEGSLFSNPSDRIYEEPESVTETPQADQVQDHAGTGPLKPRTRNTSGNHRMSGEKSDFLAKTSFVNDSKTSSIEIHKNPPSQSHDPSYTQNEDIGTVPEDDEVPATKDGKEIRSDEIRAATSMLLKDRSERLPTPTYVSDSPGRPIVSFETTYKPREPTTASGGRPGSKGSINGARPLPGKPSMPATTASAPTVPTVKTNGVHATATSAFDVQNARPLAPVPTIALPEDSTPSIQIQVEPPIPSISLPGDEPSPQRPAIPSINIGGSAVSPPSRPVPPHSHTAPASNPVLRGHWSLAQPRPSGAVCSACGLSIQGRTLSAAGHRFHPECFNCFQCSTNLEHVAFYPEPEGAQEERLAATAGQEFGAHEAGSGTPRFFCHLDFHELFSPRCKSCKTPIEADVVLACGASWHQGHFFCAQCGDPFDATVPFVEKDGWAWCVACYRGRYSGRCRACRKPVVDDGVQALGAEWHADCFVCKECNGPFEDGKFFTRGAGEGPVCVKCEERRLKA